MTSGGARGVTSPLDARETPPGQDASGPKLRVASRPRQGRGVDAGEREQAGTAERDVPVDDVVEYFEVKPSDGTLKCLPLLVHDAYERSGEQASVLVARLSAATPCPGITVLPKVGQEIGL